MTKKQLGFMAHLVVASVGFVMICCGAYLVSIQVMRAYAMIALGFLVVLIGLVWTIGDKKRKANYRGRAERHIQIFTIERPSSYPPSYAESQGSQLRAGTAPEVVVVDDREPAAMGLAPPLYSRNSSEAPNCMWSWEQPPQYSQVAQIQRVDVSFSH
ncbi:uncharacterized protein V6R79_018902 [Siganus canaliculatus]